MAVAYTLNSADSYIIWDIFHTHLEARLINNDTGVETRVSQFIWMTKEKTRNRRRTRRGSALYL